MVLVMQKMVAEDLLGPTKRVGKQFFLLKTTRTADDLSTASYQTKSSLFGGKLTN
jgi:hypothetical protein